MPGLNNLNNLSSLGMANAGKISSVERDAFEKDFDSVVSDRVINKTDVLKKEITLLEGKRFFIELTGKYVMGHFGRRRKRLPCMLLKCYDDYFLVKVLSDASAGVVSDYKECFDYCSVGIDYFIIEQ